MPIRDQHPSQVDLARFLRSEMSSGETRTVLRHLMRGCTRCSEALEEMRAGTEYDAAFDRLLAAAPSLERRVEAERRAGSELWHTLRRKDHGSRLLILRNDPRYHTWGLFDFIISLVRPSARINPFEAVDLAHLALTIAELLQVEDYGEERLHDFLGIALSHLGYAKRRAGDFQGAAEALERAGEALASGSGDLLERAMLDVNTASLLSDLGRFEEAIQRLDAAIQRFRGLDDRRGVALAVIQQSFILTFIDPRQGIARAEKGLTLLPRRRGEPYAELSARHTIAWCYNDLGEPRHARALVESCELYDRLMDPIILGNRSWLLGRICMGEGNCDGSMEHFSDAIRLLGQAQLHFESTLVTLDRIEALVRAARLDEALQLARTTHALLQGWGLQQDSLRLWLLMMEAIRTGRFLADRFRDAISDHLRRTWVLRPTGGLPASDSRGVS